MRVLLLIAPLLLLLACSEASAQACFTGCGCQVGKNGSGWRRMDTREHKCLPCDEVDRYCGKGKVNCHWEGCPNLALIRVQCPQHIPRAPCPMK
jgi:hypothetical protein